MAARRVGVSWGGTDWDIIVVEILARLPPYGADPSEDEASLVFYRLLDGEDEATGEVVGLEIDDFLEFDRWNLIPDTADLWQLGEDVPRPPVDLLKNLQAQLLARTKVSLTS